MAGIGRITRTTLDVVEQLLGLIGKTPVDIEDKVQLVAEVRAVRPWEEFRERVIRWGCRFNIGPTAAQTSYVTFSLARETTPGNPAPRGSLLILDGVINELNANAILVGWVDNAGLGAIGVASPVIGFKDNREGPFTAAPPGLIFNQGTTAAVPTTQVHKNIQVASAPMPSYQEEWGYVQQATGALGEAGQVLFVGGTGVNLQITGRAWGRLVLPR